MSLWRPIGTSEQEMEAFFLGKTPSLSSSNCLYTNAWKDRFRLVTASAGNIAIELQCMTRYLNKQGIDDA